MAELEKVNDEYRSIEAPSEGLFKDNGSRFIALAYPVETEGQVKEIVSSLKKEYHDARHHCYAYRLGYRADVFRANDDGEPSGSAGRPILGQIDSLGLSGSGEACIHTHGPETATIHGWLYTTGVRIHAREANLFCIGINALYVQWSVQTLLRQIATLWELCYSLLYAGIIFF